MRLGSGVAVAVAVAVASSCSSDLTPSLGTSICQVCGPKKTKRQKTKQNKKTQKNLNSLWSSRRGTGETNPTRNHKVVGSIPGLAQGVKDPVLP